MKIGDTADYKSALPHPWQQSQREGSHPCQGAWDAESGYRWYRSCCSLNHRLMAGMPPASSYLAEAIRRCDRRHPLPDPLLHRRRGRRKRRSRVASSRVFPLSSRRGRRGMGRGCSFPRLWFRIANSGPPLPCPLLHRRRGRFKAEKKKLFRPRAVTPYRKALGHQAVLPRSP